MSSAANLRLGNHLKRLREERKLTLGGVEALSGGYGERINKTYLFRVERGKTTPTIRRLRVLAKVYHVRLTQLLEVLDSAFDEQEHQADINTNLADASFEELRDRGVEAENEGDFPRALIFYRGACDRALAEGPPNARAARFAMAKKAGRLGLAREEAEEALELRDLPTPLLDKIKLNLADIYRRLGRSVVSREFLSGLLVRGAETTDEIHSGAHSLMGSALIDTQPAAAARHYRSALAFMRRLKRPIDECGLLHNIGLAESRAGNYKRALKVLRRARELASNKEFVWVGAKIESEIAKTLYLMGDPSSARAAFRDANKVARQREYYELLFINGYYLRQLAIQSGDATEAKATEASLRFFATRLEESFEELEAFKQEQSVHKEDRP